MRLPCYFPLFFLSTLFFTTACDGSGSATENGSQAGAELPLGDNSRNALDWNGTYQGTVPCGDCEGIQTKITLMQDGTFRRTQTYLGKDDTPIRDRGGFIWNEAGSAVILKASDGTIQMYQVGENVLFQLDQSGKRITGDLADRYRLEKNYPDPRLEDKRWVLVELRGQAFEPRDGARETFLLLDSERGVISGFGVCNNFNGPYELMPNDRITIGSNLATTMMICPEEALEKAFFEVLKTVDNYNLTDSVLTLNRARMAPLARFRHVPE